MPAKAVLTSYGDKRLALTAPTRQFADYHKALKKEAAKDDAGKAQPISPLWPPASVPAGREPAEAPPSESARLLSGSTASVQVVNKCMLSIITLRDKTA